jgi:peroxiredoxin
MHLKRVALPWAGAAVSIACAVASRVWAPAAGFALLGVIAAGMGVMSFNALVSRAAYWIACAANAAALFFVTGSASAGASALIATAPIFGAEWAVRRSGYKLIAFADLIAVAAGWFLFVVAWPIGTWALLLGITLLLATFVVVMMTSSQRTLAAFGRPAWRISVGDPVPDFTLKDRRGTSTFTLSNERGHYVLLAFVRGDWCPVCHMKLRIYQKEAARLDAHNVKLVVVSTSAGDDSATFARDLGIDVPLLADPECEVADLFGAAQPNVHAGKKSAVPSAFLIDPRGRLVHTSPPDDLGSFLDPRQVPDLLEGPATAPVFAS